MLRFVTLFAAMALAAAAPNPTNIFQIDITPEEAQKYLNSPPFAEPQLSGRKAVLPLVRYNDPRFRTVDAGPTLGHYWKNGKEIENTEDYVEEVYDAAQYHGQDGLGAYVYGYETPESAKVENRVRSGNVAGSYTYKSPNNELIKVRYWADSQGFHQEDNIPKVELKPIEEAADVREARLAHEKAWKEAAALSAQQPDPQGAYDARYEYQPQASETQSVVAPAPADEAVQAREGKAFQGYNQAQSYNQAQGNYQGFAGTSEKYEEPEPTGPPRGFFYSYTYPVSILVAKSDAQPGSLNPGYPVDKDTVSVGEFRG